MTLSRKMLLAGFGAVVTLASLNAAPPPGLRWSDHAGLRGSTATPAATSSTAFRSTSSVSGQSALGQTVTVRGADGVLRTYPLASTAVVTQGQGGQSPAAIRTTPPAAMPPAPMPTAPATTPSKKI